jgi:hypothetical protein
MPNNPQSGPRRAASSIEISHLVPPMGSRAIRRHGLLAESETTEQSWSKQREY